MCFGGGGSIQLTDKKFGPLDPLHDGDDGVDVDPVMEDRSAPDKRKSGLVQGSLLRFPSGGGE